MTAEPAKILLVDDQPANLFALEQILAAPGHELVRAESGEKALAFLLKGECAVILLDVSMPGMDGYEVARLLRTSPRTRDIPIVFLTAHSPDELDVLGGYESGAIDYIVKPVRAEVLRSKVAGFVALYRARQEIRRQAELLREHERHAHRHALAELELRALHREQAAQRRYQTLVDGLARSVAWVLDPVSLVPRFVSPGVEELLGLAPDWWTAEPRGWTERVHPGDRERFLSAVRALAPGGPATRLEHRLVHADGHAVWFETSLRLIPGEDPSTHELHGLSTDVTDGVAAREASAFLARASAELAGSLDVESTLRTAVRLAVPALADWCVIEAAGVGGGRRDVVSAHADPGREEAAQAAALELDLGRVRAGGVAVLAAPGALFPGAGGRLDRLVPAAALLVPLEAHGSRLGTLCLFVQDPVQLDPARRALVEALGGRVGQALENAVLHEQTRAAVLAREEFLSIASHELRTPLSALSLQARMLIQVVERVTDPAETREELRRRVASVQRQVARLGALTNSVLDLTRIRTARLRLELESCDLCEVARDVVARFEEGLRADGRALDLSAPAPLVGRWDRTRLEQLLSNLVGNAVKHGGRGDISISVERSGDVARLAVSDTGPGIPEPEQARVFEAFAQGRRAAAGGLGLGLYIARAIAAAHGGSISLATGAATGTTFRVELPLVAEEPARAPVPSAGAFAAVSPPREPDTAGAGAAAPPG